MTLLSNPVVPTITRDQIAEAARALGLDYSAIRSLHIERGYVQVEFLAVDSTGKRRAAGDRAATVVMQIPVVDDVWDRPETVTVGSYAGDSVTYVDHGMG